MIKKVLVSVVEDDRFFRESMRRLMRSLGYAVALTAIPFLLGLAIIPFAHETKGEALP